MFLEKLKKWADQQLNGNEELTCLKEKALDKLRYCNIKIKRIKIEDTMKRNNRMFQEDQGIFYRKTQEMKQLEEKVPKMEKPKSGKATPKLTKKMDEHSFKENMTKRTKQLRNERIGLP